MSNPLCLSNPDIAGIGVRIAIYAQNLLSFVPAVWAIWDKKVTEFELESVEKQSTTILITAFAILITAIVQQGKGSLSNLDGLIVLNLSWMNNTNTFIWFSLYVYQKGWRNIIRKVRDRLPIFHRNRKLEDSEGKGNMEKERKSEHVGMLRQFVQIINRYGVLILGTFHLSLMAALGIWLWSPETTQTSCLTSTFVVGSKISSGQGQGGLRDWSLLIYSMLLLPGFNMILPILFFRTFHFLYNSLMPVQGRNNVAPVVIELVILGVINIIFVINTEVTLQLNKSQQQNGGDSNWTFGQIIALLLLVLPLRDLVESVMEKSEGRRKREHTVNLRRAVEHGSIDLIKGLVEDGADVNVQTDAGSKFATALQLASSLGEIDIVEFLLEKKADINIQGGMYDTAIQAALCKGHLSIIDLLKNKTEWKGNALWRANRLWKDMEWDMGWGLLLLLPRQLQEEKMTQELVANEVQKAAFERAKKMKGEELPDELVISTLPNFMRFAFNQDQEHKELGLSILRNLAHAAKFQDAILAGLPDFMELLKNKYYSVRKSAASAFGEISKQDKFQDAILAGLPDFMKLLQDKEYDVRESAASAFAEICKQDKFHHVILAGLPDFKSFFMKLLKDRTPAARLGAASAFAQISKQDKFQDAVLAGLPDFMKLLQDEYRPVRMEAASAFAEISKQDKFQDAILAGLPDFMKLLQDESLSVRGATASAFAEISKQDKFQDAILAGLPNFMKLLQDGDYEVRRIAPYVFVEVSKQDKFQDAILAALPDLTKLLYDWNKDVRSAAASALVELSKQGKFRDAIAAILPAFTF